MNRFKLIASGYLFLINNNKILLLRRQNTGYEDGKYGLPSGHLEPHETIRNCCQREAKEEIGISIAPKNLHLVHVMHRTHIDERIDFFFTATSWDGEVQNMEPGKCDDVTWFPIDSLPENCIPYIKFALEQYQMKNNFSEYGWK